MKISWGNHVTGGLDFMSASNGYGYATERVVASLRRLGHEVESYSRDADIHFHFDQPHHLMVPKKDMFTVMYFPWESTNLIQKGQNLSGGVDWLEKMNSVDEVWTPSPMIADWMQRYMGITRPIYVFEHGVDKIWTPKKRKVEGKFKFLHCGGEAARKGAVDTMKALRLAFPKNNDVELNMKIISEGWHVGKIHRVNILNKRFEIDELVNLYHENHAYVYPSYGEGFGLTPLQAMATGMPTITVPAWAPYRTLLNPKLSIDSGLVQTPWPNLHPGKVLKPNMDDIVDAMRYAYENYDEVCDDAMKNVDEIVNYYDWDRLTKEAFEALGKRLQGHT